MDDRTMVTVPDLVGQPVHIARELADRVGLSLASGDPDGPGIGSRTWPGVFWVTAQDPAAGSILTRGTQVRVEFVADGQARGDITVSSDGPTRPPERRAHADPEER